MPTIACLGWGSLIWEPRDLPVRGEWRPDGPSVNVEFLRRSGKGRVTLVLDESATSVPALWTLLNVPHEEAAVIALETREGTFPRNRKEHIGIWTVGQDNPPLIEALPSWAQENHIDAVVWTNLPRKFHESGICATAEEIVTYLGGLTGTKRENAEEYVRKAPVQIATAYREAIAETLGWTPLPLT